jgi:uncharacterized glyoxalase superfamily protein PhnB
MDAPPGLESPIGGNGAIAIDVDDETQAERIFAKLVQDGATMLPFDQIFGARKFAPVAVART